MTDAAPLVRIRDLAYSYPEGPEILRIPALNVSGRGLIAITGPSGAGKSTFVELLAGTLQSGYEGSVEVLGSEWRDLRRDADRQRHLRRIGFIPQDFGLLPDRTPRQMLQQDLTDSGVSTDEHAERIDRALAEVEIVDLADQRIASLSGGQGQRVAIARMLARDVDLVIADEPTANLDPGLRSVIMGLLRKLSAHVPVIVVTHDAAVAEACDRTIILQPAASRFDENPPKSLPHKRRPRVVFFLIIVLLLVLGASGAALALALGSSNKAGAAVGLRVVTISASESLPRYLVRIPYPQLVSSESNAALTRINIVLANAAQAPVASFEQGLYSDTSVTLPELANDTSTLTGTATTDLFDGQFASFSLDGSQFGAGAAHPIGTIGTFNFDVQTGERIQLADLFQPGSDWLSVLSEESRTLLPPVIGQDSLPGMLGAGTAPSASNFKAWALTSWGLSITFQEYQVGIYADGQPTILIPFSALQSVALAGGPLSSIEASRPLRSPLLPAVVPPVVNECMAPTTWGSTGLTPLKCATGALNVNAWDEWNISGNSSLPGLGRGAALKIVEKAMCADVKPDPSYSAPYEVRLETFAALYYGWRFAANPASHFPEYCTTIASKTSSS